MTELHPGLARTLLEDLPVGIVFLDTSDRVAWANRTLAAILDMPRENVIGEKASRLRLPTLTQQRENVGDNNPSRLLSVVHRHDSPLFQGTALVVIDPDRTPLRWNGDQPDELSALVGMLDADEARRRLAIEISRSRRYDNPLACIYVQLLSNRRRQGLTGQLQSALDTLIRLLREKVRWVDVIGHWNPDSVVVVLPETNAAAAAQLSEKLALHVANAWAILSDEFTVSWGSSSWRKGDDIDAFVERAIECAVAYQPSSAQSGRP